MKKQLLESQILKNMRVQGNYLKINEHTKFAGLNGLQRQFGFRRGKG